MMCFCDNVVNVKARTGEQDYHARMAAVAHNYALRKVRGDEAWQTTDWGKREKSVNFMNTVLRASVLLPRERRPE